MINPTDFYKTAGLLANSNDECHIRTSISRSYYGLFLYIRDYLVSQGVKLPPHNEKSHHSFIRECIKKSRFYKDKKESGNTNKKGVDKIIVGILKRFETLQSNRFRADYELTLLYRQKDSEDNLRLAKTAVDDIQKLQDTGRKKHIVSIANLHASKY